MKEAATFAVWPWFAEIAVKLRSAIIESSQALGNIPDD